MKPVLFSIEEENIVAIYHGRTLKGTIESMQNVVRFVKDSELRHIMVRTIAKLQRLTEEEYKSRSFNYTE